MGLGAQTPKLKVGPQMENPRKSCFSKLFIHNLASSASFQMHYLSLRMPGASLQTRDSITTLCFKKKVHPYDSHDNNVK